jgi:hypothetical protein
MSSSVTLDVAKGFTLFMLKAVMSNRADEIIGLAKTTTSGVDEETARLFNMENSPRMRG